MKISHTTHCRGAGLEAPQRPLWLHRVAQPLLIHQDKIHLKGFGHWKGIGYAARVALLGHYNMVVHHGGGVLVGRILVLGSGRKGGGNLHMFYIRSNGYLCH